MRRTIIHTLSISVFFALFAGCGQNSDNQADFSPPVDETKAIAIARKAVAANDTWVESATFEPMAESTGWTVIVWREPRTPGGFRVISIDDDGKVTRYSIGH